MENLYTRLQQLEIRTRKIERKLLWWRLATLCVCICIFSVLYVHSGEAQSVSTTNAPFEVKGGAGQTLLRVDEYQPQGPTGPKEAALTLYVNGQPAAAFRTTGKMYKDPEDRGYNYLNLLETYLYQYSQNAQRQTVANPQLAASLGLTRAGGSLVLWNLPRVQGSQATQAARLTAKRNIGGSLILFNKEGIEGQNVKP